MYPNRLRHLRTKMGISQEKAARKIGISWSMWSKIERGERLPSLPLAQRIANLLGCTIDEIFPQQLIPGRPTDSLDMASDGRA